MFKNILYVVLSLGFAFSLKVHANEMEQLSFLIGNWQGQGWRINYQGEKETFDSEEIVQKKLGGTLLKIEGFHKKEGKVVHNAFAILSFNKRNKKFRFSSYLSDGRQGEYEATFSNNKLTWQMKFSNKTKVRFIIHIDEKGRWYEIGEISVNDGPWKKNFEMILEKKAKNSALEETQKIKGTYEGKWSMYGVDQNKKRIELTSWTDKLIASDVSETAERALIKIVDKMTFPNGSVRETNFIEGFYKNKFGAAGERFYEIYGTVVKFKKLSKNTWTFETPVDPRELSYLGFNPQKVISATHTSTKVTTYENEKDTDHVTRLTTVQWKDDSDKLQSIQFVSMKGYHTRIK